MDRRGILMRLAQEMRQATQKADWTAMAQIDREIATQLSGQRDVRSWSEAERGALAELRAAHRAALDACEHATAALDERLAELCTHKDGWIAYALNDWQENPA